MEQWLVYSAQNTDTDVKASSDGSGWGSNSGCESQGSCARQGATMDIGDSGCGKERTAVAKAAVTQGSCVVCAQLVQAAMEAQSCRALAVAVTAAAEAKELRATAEAGGGNERCEN